MTVQRWPTRRWRWVGLVALVACLVGLAIGAGWAWWGEGNPPARLVIPLPEVGVVQGLSVDGRSIVLGGDHGLMAWEIATGQRVRPDPATFLSNKAVSRDGRRVAGVIVDRATGRQAVVVADPTGAATEVRFPLVDRWTRRVDWVDDGTVRAFLESQAGPIEVATWDLSSGRATTRPLRAPAGPTRWEVAFGPDGRNWAYLDKIAGRVQFWDAEADAPLGSPAASPEPLPSGTFGICWFPPDGQTLLCGRGDGRIEVWDAARQRYVRTLKFHPDDHRVHSFAATPDGRTLASTAISHPPTSGFGALWETAKVRLTGRRSIAERQEVVLFDPSTLAVRARLAGCTLGAFTPDGRSIVTNEFGHRLAVRDLADLIGDKP